MRRVVRCSNTLATICTDVRTAQYNSSPRLVFATPRHKIPCCKQVPLSGLPFLCACNVSAQWSYLACKKPNADGFVVSTPNFKRHRRNTLAVGFISPDSSIRSVECTPLLTASTYYPGIVGTWDITVPAPRRAVGNSMPVFVLSASLTYSSEIRSGPLGTN